MVKMLKLIKQKDVTENLENTFENISEASIDADNFTINGVCLFGRRESANNRVYSNKAIESIAKFSAGAKCFANHISKDELKNRSGVRSIHDWVGVFNSPAVKGDAIFANLKVRESYWDLVKDIAIMQPNGVGHSIDARVKVFTDQSGKESVVDVESLRSCDLVASTATTTTLWESLTEKIEENKAEDFYFPELLERKISDAFKIVILEEGIIQDKLDNDKIKYAISDITYTANGLIEKCLYDEKLSVDDKKKKVMAIFDDLDKEVKKKMSEIKEQININGQGEDEMELTVEAVKANKEIFESIINEYKESEENKKVKGLVPTLEAKVADLEKVITEKDAAIAEKDTAMEALKTELSDAKKKIDDITVSEALAAKEAMIEKLIKEADLPAEAVTDVFKETLRGIKESKVKDSEGKEEKVITVEEGMKKIIEDRKLIVKTPKKVVTNSGDEFFVKDSKESKGNKAVEDKDVDSFIKNIKK